ncbi:MAG: hypothetical protein ACR2LR_21885 [Hassallia sp.]
MTVKTDLDSINEFGTLNNLSSDSTKGYWQKKVFFLAGVKASSIKCGSVINQVDEGWQ